ncbi:hypothetical protein EHF33_14990 [Deinococcus psychrotolerans]|uniref:Uncharacterized protein n=1 Tax=Deinococcus psychrotolerans TaxID=2489213 RepID=A0A3G8YGY4_9DEIO|nr:hypothetical protein [Deinococcus psychrotolerans]AZI44205.1 hypothetical protein EHF33_14990 [Deinococcus psychrotolerans]
MPQIVSGRYENHNDAMQSVWGVHAAGLPLNDIALVSLNMQPSAVPISYTLHPNTQPFDAQLWWAGFFEALLSRPLDSQSLRAYLGVIRSGAYLMLAHGTAEHIRSAQRVLEDSGACDIVVRPAEADGSSEIPAFTAVKFPPASGLER